MLVVIITLFITMAFVTGINACSSLWLRTALSTEWLTERWWPLFLQLSLASVIAISIGGATGYGGVDEVYTFAIMATVTTGWWLIARPHRTLVFAVITTNLPVTAVAYAALHNNPTFAFELAVAGFVGMFAVTLCFVALNSVSSKQSPDR